MDTSIQKEEDPETIMRRVKAAEQQQKWKAERICTEIVEILVNGAESRSCGMEMIDCVLEQVQGQHCLGLAGG